MSTKYTAPRGTIDFLPPESQKHLYVETVFRDVAELYGYQPIRTPSFESTELFARGAGESSDIVSKEMYTFPDKKGRSMTLRPEGTPGVVRALIQAGLNFNHLARLYYVASMFRYQRPQKGRYREHTQAGVEIFGSDSVTADVEVISLGINFLKGLGLSNLRVAVNSIGSVEDRNEYNEQLKKFIDEHKADFCPDCHFRAEHNPLRTFDCKVPECLNTLKAAPGISGSLSTASRERFETLQALLKDEGMEIDVDPMLVRGLDYYTHTVFEVMMRGESGQQSSLMGGGRYDGLVEMYGGPAVPAMGFGSGIERIMEAMDWTDRAWALKPQCDVAIVALGAPGLNTGIGLADTLRSIGVAAFIDHKGGSLKNQLGQAGSLDASFAVIIGENELKEGSAMVKDMNEGSQEKVPFADVVEYLQNMLDQQFCIPE
jgi:histidyl-tRNA synthetase